MTESLTHDFDDNQVRLQLFAMAYNIGNFLRRLTLPNQIKDWSLQTMRERLVKIGAKVVSHARYVTFQMAEVLVSKSLFHQILVNIHRLKRIEVRVAISNEISTQFWRKMGFTTYLEIMCKLVDLAE